MGERGIEKSAEIAVDIYNQQAGAPSNRVYGNLLFEKPLCEMTQKEAFQQGYRYGATSMLMQIRVGLFKVKRTLFGHFRSSDVSNYLYRDYPMGGFNDKNEI